jgi:RNA polymerase sigma-70 factor (ECF subfamily)
VDLGDRRPAAVAHEHLSDVVLAARSRDGDQRALEALLTRHQATVRRLTRFQFSDERDAEDSAQDALSKAYGKISTFRGEASFSTWLHRLTLNACADHRRRQQRRQRSELSVAEPQDLAAGNGAPAADAGLDSRSLPADLEAGVAALSARQRTVVVMKDVLAMRYDEIAEALGLPVGTVKCHAHRGRNALAASLERRKTA